jgi:hypothetical protein
MRPRDWLVWGAFVVIGAIVLPLAFESTAVAVVLLALLATWALVRFWLRRRRAPDERRTPT